VTPRTRSIKGSYMATYRRALRAQGVVGSEGEAEGLDRRGGPMAAAGSARRAFTLTDAPASSALRSASSPSGGRFSTSCSDQEIADCTPIVS
jgi:hypothetical protein